ncbi:MAG: D-ala-D-ala transporter subunit, partial [Armatimonadota bacterium]
MPEPSVSTPVEGGLPRRTAWQRLPLSVKLGGAVIVLVLLGMVAGWLNPTDPDATGPARLAPPSAQHP